MPPESLESIIKKLGIVQGEFIGPASLDNSPVWNAIGPDDTEAAFNVASHLFKYGYFSPFGFLEINNDQSDIICFLRMLAPRLRHGRKSNHQIPCAA